MKYKFEAPADSPDVDDTGIQNWLDHAWDMAIRPLTDCEICRHGENPDCDHDAEKK